MHAVIKKCAQDRNPGSTLAEIWTFPSGEQWEEVFSENKTSKVQAGRSCIGLKDDPKQNENNKPACQHQQAYLDSLFRKNHIVVVQIRFGENKSRKLNWLYKVKYEFFCRNSKNTLKWHFFGIGRVIFFEVFEKSYCQVYRENTNANGKQKKENERQ